MISLSGESLIPLRDVPKHVPSRANGKRLHISAVYRWITRGFQGVVLEAIRIGGTTYTSREALQRFAELLSGNRSPHPAVAQVTTPKARERTNRLLEARLRLPPGSIG